MLRRAMPSELSVIVDLTFAMFAEAGRVHLLSDRFREWVLADYRRLYGTDEAVHFVATEDNEIVGMAGGGSSRWTCLTATSRTHDTDSSETFARSRRRADAGPPTDLANAFWSGAGATALTLCASLRLRMDARSTRGSGS